MDISPFDYQCPTRIVFGPGRSRDLGPDLAPLAPKPERALIVTDPGVAKAGLAEGISASLAGLGARVRVYDRVASDPGSAMIDDLAGVVREWSPQLVIGLGGGSPMDAAKLGAAVGAGEPGPDQAPGADCQRYACCAQDLPPRRAALVMIPTTAGTGAEVTQTAIFSDTQGRKLWAWGPQLIPDLALLDPELTFDLPPGLSAATGLDALVHAIEAATSGRADPLARAFGREAIRMGAADLRKVLAEPRNLEARSGLLIAACLAGLAIERAGTGLAHALGHALGGLAKVHHGTAVALAEGVVLPFNAEQDRELHTEIIRDLGGAEYLSAGSGAAAERTWSELLDRCGLDRSAIPKDAADQEEIAAACLAPENRPMVDNNHRTVGPGELEELVDRLLNP